jgi:hypothetical protein
VTWIGLLGLVLAVGCAPKLTHVKRPLTPPPLVYCHDGTGHVAGVKPWILGGMCCCTPTKVMFATHQSEGTVPADMSYDKYLKLYADKGVKTDLDHMGCNNRCVDGPHVVLGGKCMATPTPGTANYEWVTQGEKPDPRVIKTGNKR